MTAARRLRLLSMAAGILAALVALAAAGGIWLPAVYARETASWAAQGAGQDWVDLVVVAPLLLVCALGLARSRLALLGFGGALVYVTYSFVLYAFAMHFNPLFLVYCATLGIAFYALLGVALHLQREDASVWFGDRLHHAGLLGGFAIVMALGFAALWLAGVVPALLTGTDPAGLAEAGLVTNPVYVLDLSLVLPALMITGIAMRRGRGWGVFAGAIMMGFNVLMTLALVGMMVAMRARGLAADLGVLSAMGVLCVASLLALVVMLRQLRPTGEPRARYWLDRTHPV